MAAKQRTIRITISTSETVHKYLKALIPLGLYGGSVAEVAERLICGALQNDLRRRKTILLDPEQDGMIPVVRGWNWPESG